MGLYSIRRAFWVLTVLFGVSIVVFLLLRLAPGDPALILLGPGATPSEVATIRHELGLEESLFLQYVVFIKKAILLDLGESISYRQPVTKLVLDAFRPTIELSFVAFGLAIIISIPAGILSAVKKDSIYDKIVMSGVLLGQSIAPFWLGIMLIFFSLLCGRFFPLLEEVRSFIWRFQHLH